MVRDSEDETWEISERARGNGRPGCELFDNLGIFKELKSPGSSGLANLSHARKGSPAGVICAVLIRTEEVII